MARDGGIFVSMPRSSERRLEALETHFRELLIIALERCARGQWGLFGQNDQVIARMNSREKARHRQAPIQELLDLGGEIERERHRRGIVEPFDLHQRLVLIRSTNDSNSPDEPELARRWLDEMHI